ncbi:MAG: NAD(P) transhydrogenase subunit alpha [Rhodospirillales bacterium]
MVIGIPREILDQENRVAALPETVRAYVQMGFEVAVERNAGTFALATDEAYAEAGARIADNAEDLYARSEIILKVKQPCFNQSLGRHEVELMREGAILISFLHPAAPANHDMIRMLAQRGITSFTLDSIPRISRAQPMDALTSMSTVTGYRAVLMAAIALPKFIPMLGTAIGTIKPARFLIVGAGVVGLQAIATAKRLGAPVTAVDINEQARKAAESLGAKIGGFDVPPQLAVDANGYARALPAEWLEKERAALAPLLEQADVAIFSALVPGEVAPVLATAAMVERMRPGSVIIDVAIDQGGNCALTEPGVESRAGGVHICGRLNIPGSMPVHASWLYAQNVLNFVRNLFKKGTTPDWSDEIVAHTLVTRGGQILHQGALKAMQALVR